MLLARNEKLNVTNRQLYDQISSLEVRALIFVVDTWFLDTCFIDHVFIAEQK